MGAFSFKLPQPVFLSFVLCEVTLSLVRLLYGSYPRSPLCQEKEGLATNNKGIFPASRTQIQCKNQQGKGILSAQ